jgi:hypothetical protein
MPVLSNPGAASVGTFRIPRASRSLRGAEMVRSLIGNLLLTGPDRHLQRFAPILLSKVNSCHVRPSICQHRAGVGR